MSAPRHFAIVAPPTPGHLNPLLALGAALGALGHRVTVVHLADARRFVPDTPIAFAALRGAGDRAGVLDAYLATLAQATGPFGLPHMIRATAAMSKTLLDALPAALERIGAEVVIADAAEGAGAVAAARAGLPCIASVTGLPLLREPGVPPPYLGWRYRRGAWGLFRNWGGYLVSDRLLRPLTRAVGKVPEPLLHVAQCPRAFDFPRRRLPAAFHYGAPWRLPEAPAPDLPGDRPLVFCSLGTLQGARAHLFAGMARACEQAGARAVVAHGGALSEAAAASLPGGAVARAWWPQRGVLAKCSAAILHGGFNTVLDALAAGVPIVAAPIAFEQPATAARVAHHGVGRVVKRPSADRLAAALKDVLTDPAYRLAAERMRMPSDGATQAAALIDAALSA